MPSRECVCNVYAMLSLSISNLFSFYFLLSTTYDIYLHWIYHVISIFIFFFFNFFFRGEVCSLRSDSCSFLMAFGMVPSNDNRTHTFAQIERWLFIRDVCYHTLSTIFGLYSHSEYYAYACEYISLLCISSLAPTAMWTIKCRMRDGND